MQYTYGTIRPDKPANTYLTKDLGEATALVTEGVKFIGLEREGSFYWFVFDGTRADEVSQIYWSGDLKVSAKLFSDNLRTLKDRLFSRK